MNLTIDMAENATDPVAPWNLGATGSFASCCFIRWPERFSPGPLAGSPGLLGGLLGHDHRAVRNLALLAHFGDEVGEVDGHAADLPAVVVLAVEVASCDPVPRGEAAVELAVEGVARDVGEMIWKRSRPSRDRRMTVWVAGWPLTGRVRIAEMESARRG